MTEALLVSKDVGLGLMLAAIFGAIVLIGLVLIWK